MRKLVSLAVAASFIAGSVAVPVYAAEKRPAAVSAAEQGLTDGEYSAYRGTRRGRGRTGRNVAAGAAVAGVAGALIGGAIASQQRRDYDDRGYYGRRQGYYGGSGPSYDPYY